MLRYDTPPYYITAYGLAVKHGFKGTEEEWLASLKANEIEIRYLNGMLQWRRVPNESEESDTPTDAGEAEDEGEDLYAWHDLIDIAGIRGEAIEQAMAETFAAAEIAKSEAAKVDGTRAFAEAANQTAEIALGIAEETKENQTGLEQLISEVDRELQGRIQDVGEDAAAAKELANDVAQEIKTYSPAGTRSIAEAAMRMASERLVAPKTASVGQYFRVEEVDENGVVTAVEAVDAPAAGGIDGDLDMKGCNVKRVGSLDFEPSNDDYSQAFWMQAGSDIKNADGSQTAVAEFYSSESDLPVVLRHIANGMQDDDAVNLAQLKTRLLAPLKAAVGQYIRITAVDENGVVTAVEAVDAPAAGGGTNEVFAKLEDGSVVPAEAEFDLSEANTPALVVVPDTAKVGQTIVVKAVDENGKPTKWEAVDLPSGGAGGGAGQWEHICDITTTEDIDAGISVTENSEGVPLSELKYNEIWVMAKMVGVDTNTYNWWKCLCTMHQVGDSTQTYSKKTNGASSGGTTGTRYVTFYTFIRGGKFYHTNGSKTDLYCIDGGSQAWLNHFLDKYLFDYFTEVEIPADPSCIIGADTEIRILGRRA